MIDGLHFNNLMKELMAGVEVQEKRSDRIAYEDRIVCFIDILGFKKIIAGTTTKDNVTEVERVYNALMEVRSSFWLDGSAYGDKYEDINNSRQITHFSDCIVISFKTDEPSEMFCTLYNVL
ncbi:MAG: hypothetical protein HQK96_21015, partial [Nitrospirae bacterium]|nr:hypothetical protein [Nitrospirota bacterium]